VSSCLSALPVYIYLNASSVKLHGTDATGVALCNEPVGGMRNLAPNHEEDCSDRVQLNGTVSAALRSYLPQHFPGLTPLRRRTSAAATAAAVPATAAVRATAAVPATFAETSPKPLAVPAATEGMLNCVETDENVVIEKEWIGIMGFTKDRNPLVGPLANRPGEFIAAGYTGHGMPVAFLAAKNIADMICGKESEIPLPRAYYPSRFSL
jgi:hypothetical protein